MLGLLDDIANAIGYAGAYLLEFTGGDIFNKVSHNGSVLGLKVTDLSADSPNLCKVIGLHSVSFPSFGNLLHGVGLGAHGDVDVVLHRDAEDLVDEPGVFEPGVQAGNPR